MIYIFFIILLVTYIIKSFKKEKSSKNINKIITTSSIENGKRALQLIF